jgi:hypothetical protein
VLLPIYRNCNSSCGFSTGSIRSSTWLNTVKIAVFAPMPKASVNTAVTVNPGARAICRNAYRTSCMIPFIASSSCSRYSARKAFTGSVPAARRAGIKPAMQAATASASVAPAITPTSYPLVP